MVHFVGAGPGAFDLITIRGAEALSRADVVIYTGSLVRSELLEHCKKETVKIFDSSKMSLHEAVDEMVRAHEAGLFVVRLHTGDPSIYGAIREQMDELKKRGIDYEVIPGVSSMCAAAAAVKAEYTLPKVSQSVIVTRMAGRTPVPDKESIASLAVHGATMVIFLSAGMLDALSKELLKGAYNEDTPAAIVYKATHPDEMIVHTTVGGLYEAGKKNGIDHTALVLVGDFLGDEYELSKLYDPSFETGYRKADDKGE